MRHRIQNPWLRQKMKPSAHIVKATGACKELIHDGTMTNAIYNSESSKQLRRAVSRACESMNNICHTSIINESFMFADAYVAILTRHMITRHFFRCGFLAFRKCENVAAFVTEGPIAVEISPSLQKHVSIYVCNACISCVYVRLKPDSLSRRRLSLGASYVIDFCFDFCSCPRSFWSTLCWRRPQNCFSPWM